MGTKASFSFFLPNFLSLAAYKRVTSQFTASSRSNRSQQKLRVSVGETHFPSSFFLALYIGFCGARMIKIDKDKTIEAILKFSSKLRAIESLGLPRATGYRKINKLIKEYNLDISHMTGAAWNTYPYRIF